METEKLITIFITAILTFSFTKLWDWWRETKKTKYEEAKLLKKSLFNLFNLWQTLHSWNFEEQTEFASKMIFEQFAKMGAKPEDLEKLKLNAADKSKLISYQTRSATEKLKIFDEQLNEAIGQLSEINPLVASQIHEMRLLTPFESSNKMIEHQKNEGKIPSEFDLRLIASLENQHFQAYVERLSDRLKPFLLCIAKEVNKKTLKETEQYIQNLEKERSELFKGDNVKDMQLATESFVNMLIKAHVTASLEEPIKRPLADQQKVKSKAIKKKLT